MNTNLKHFLTGVVVTCLMLGAFVGVVSGEMWYADLHPSPSNSTFTAIQDGASNATVDGFTGLGKPPSIITYTDEGGRYTSQTGNYGSDHTVSSIEEDQYTSEETTSAGTPAPAETATAEVTPIPIETTEPVENATPTEPVENATPTEPVESATPTETMEVSPSPEETLEAYFTPMENQVIAASSTWYVDDDLVDYPNADFTRIQDAVNNASAGDTIVVMNGVYYEHVNVTKQLTIKSANGADNCILDGSGNGDDVQLYADGITIEGFTVRNSGSTQEYAGIRVRSSSNNIISNHASNYFGIYLDSSNNNTLTNNTANSNNWYGIGIYLSSSNNNTLMNNTANSNNYFGDGIRLDSSNNNTLTGNTANSNFEHGIYLSNSNNNTLTNNTASNNVHGIDLYYSSNNTLTNNTASNGGGISLSNSNNNTLTDNTASSNNYGISLSNSNNNTLTNNRANLNGNEGIDLYYSDNNTLTNNTANSNYDFGIDLYYSSNNTLTNNTMSTNSYNFRIVGSYINYVDSSNLVDGKPIYYWIGQENAQMPGDAGCVVLVNSRHITVEDLTLTNNGHGVLLVNTTDSLIKNVNALNNHDGISLDSSSDNTLTNNTANSNHYGIGISLSNSNNNTLTDNTASNNNNGIYLSNSDNNTLTNNTANLNYDFGIYLISSSNNTLTNNTANSNSEWGIWLQYDYGIYLVSSDNNTLTNNTANSNCHGIYLVSSDNNTLTNNTANSNYHFGIYLSSSNSNTLTNNTASNNSDNGIALYSSSNYNNLTDNTANSNNNHGILLDSSNNNTLTNNTANLNGDEGISLASSSNNRIYLNNFNNTRNVYSSESTNTWNSTSKIAYTYEGNTSKNYLGNYWSDYTGGDENGDGIGDTPYSIASDNDNYPLMVPKEQYFAPSGNQPPIANFTYTPVDLMVNELITFNASASYDPDGEIVSYEWNFGDHNSSTGVITSHRYAAAGDYTVTLTVTDDEGANGTYTLTIHVRLPFGSITNLHNTTYLPTSITWAWNDPVDADFDHVMIYLDGVFVNNVSRGIENYTATHLMPNTTYSIGTHTADRSGNINTTWVNATAKTTVKGDFNGNSYVDIGDVARVAYMVVGLTPVDPAADFTNDGEVDVADAAKIAYYYVGKIEAL
ncbi:MAG: NosD domain-containing protein [Desulfitobacteriaceae bacterium]|nr:NosD domain-containing protein [Desulfitobacteriaceae bacterium]